MGSFQRAGDALPGPVSRAWKAVSAPTVPALLLSGHESLPLRPSSAETTPTSPKHKHSLLEHATLGPHGRVAGAPGRAGGLCGEGPRAPGALCGGAWPGSGAGQEVGHRGLGHRGGGEGRRAGGPEAGCRALQGPLCGWGDRWSSGSLRFLTQLRNRKDAPHPRGPGPPCAL